MLNPRQSRRSVIMLLVGVLAVVGCGSDSPTAVLPTDFTIAAGSTSLSVARGGTVTTFVKASRVGAFTGNINFGIRGAGGLDTGIFSTSVPDSVRLSFFAAVTAPTGSVTVEVTGSHAGSATQKLTITVAITAAAVGSLTR